VTDAAILGGGQVINGFAHGGNTVVASGTATGNTGMIKHTAGKTAYGMAHAAILGREDMRRRLT